MMLFINGLLLLSFALLSYMHLETRFLFKNTITIRKTVENSFHFRIAHLSDFHIGRIFVSKKKLGRAILKNSPDCIVLTGDYIEKKSHIPKFVNFILSINPKKLPIFLVWGNHDHKVFKDPEVLKDFRQILLSHEIQVLENENRIMEKASKKLLIVGIDERLRGKPDIDKAFEGTGNEDFRIVLSHNPDRIFFLEDKIFDILLSGHFHGGQIYLPFHFEFKILRKEKLAKMGIIAGLHQVLGHKIYINRGIGNVLLPFRFLSPPEIVFFDIG